MGYRNFIIAITNFKDIITITTAIIGCIFGLSGFILGLLGYRRSNRLERDALHAPYFKKKWPEIHEGITGQIGKMSSAILDIENDFRQPASEWNAMFGRQIRKLEITFDIDKYQWDYIPGLRAKISAYIFKSEELQKAAEKYAFFAWVSTPSFALWTKLVNMQHSESGVDFYKKSQEDIASDLNAINKSIDIHKKYLRGNYNAKSLSSSKYYVLRLKIGRELLLFKIKNMKKITSSLSKILDFNNSRLS